MKKSELKKIIKPLVKECINEVLIEEGLLSNIVSEVATGLQGNVIIETKQNDQQQLFTEKQQRQESMQAKLKEQKRKMLDAIGKDAYNGVDLFEDTTPMDSPSNATPRAGAIDLGGPNDAGVDISSIMGGANKIWQAMK